VERAEAGLTVRLGSELALAGIRYVIMPDGIAPSLPGVQLPPSVPPPTNLVQALQAQSDLRQLPTEGGVIAFANVAWPAAGSPSATSVAALGSGRGGTSPTLRELGLALGLLVVATGIAEGFIRRRHRRRRRVSNIVLGGYSDEPRAEQEAESVIEPEPSPLA